MSETEKNVENFSDLSSRELAKLYDYNVHYAQDDDIYLGEVTEWPSLKAHGNSDDAALEEIKRVVSIAIEDCRENDEEYPQPFNLKNFSGRFSVRVGSTLHRELTRQAKFEGISLNQLIVRKLSTR